MIRPQTLLDKISHPIGFLWHYVLRHPWGHATVFLSVLVAVICAVSVQYGLKHLIDILAAGPDKATGLWLAFAGVCGLSAALIVGWQGSLGTVVQSSTSAD